MVNVYKQSKLNYNKNKAYLKNIHQIEMNNKNKAYLKKAYS